MDQYQIDLMQENTNNLKNLSLLGAKNVPEIVDGVSNSTIALEAKKQAVWNEVTASYRPFFSGVTPLSYEYFMKMRITQGLVDEFLFNPSLIQTPKSISMTASAFMKNLKDAKFEDDNFDQEKLVEDVVKTFLQGFQNQGAETLTEISKQDPNGGGIKLVARVGSCKYCQQASQEFDTSNFKTPTFHKNCGCGKLPIWK